MLLILLFRLLLGDVVVNVVVTRLGDVVSFLAIGFFKGLAVSL